MVTTPRGWDRRGGQGVERLALAFDDEIRRIVGEAQERAAIVLTEHIDELHAISQLLTERETIDKNQFERLLAGEHQESVFAEPEPPPEPQPAKEPVP